MLALPAEFRDGARVLGYHAGSHARSFRFAKATARSPASRRIRRRTSISPCYHKSMEPFMARGRALRAQGVNGEQVDTVRFAEVKSGKLTVPTQPAALYQLFGGNVRRRDERADRRAVAVRDLHSRRDRGIDGADRQARSCRRAVDHVPRHAESAHHAHSEDVTLAN